jgi:hypothetical protein
MKSDEAAVFGETPAPTMRRMIGVSMVLGPLFGLTAIALGTAAYFEVEHFTSQFPPPVFNRLAFPVVMFSGGLLFAHVLGGIPAWLGGWLTARHVAAHGRLSYSTALRHGAVSGVLAEVGFLAFGSLSKSLASDFNALFLVPTYLAACCAGSLGCAWILRRQFPALKAGN